MGAAWDQHIRDLRDSMPEPGTDAVSRLRHTLGAFTDARDDDLAIIATTGLWPQGQTGVTWGDLRAALRALESAT